MKTRAVMEVSPRTSLVFGSSLLLIGVSIIGFRADALMLGWRSSRWPQATALLAEANYWKTSSNTTKGRSSITYHGAHLYTFSVGGESYQGSNFDVAGHMHTGIKKRADQVQSAFVKGSVVPVFYDPAQPVRSCLKNGIAEDTQVAIAFSAFFVGVGGMVLRYQIRRLRNAG